MLLQYFQALISRYQHLETIILLPGFGVGVVVPV